MRWVTKKTIVVRAIIDETTNTIQEVLPLGTRNLKSHLIYDTNSIISITREMLEKLNYFAITN